MKRIPTALFAALWRTLPDQTARTIAREAGRQTAFYVMENRIPALARFALGRLPSPIAHRLLLSAIKKNAWTFAGSGQCRIHPGSPTLIEIAGNVMSMPGCVWHAGVFETLFGGLCGGQPRVDHTACCADGASVCRFEIRFDSSAIC